MTTIAYRDGIMAADRRVTRSGYVIGMKTKIEKVGRLLIGGTGSVAVIDSFMAWVRGGCNGGCPPMGLKSATDDEYSGTGCIIMPNGRAVLFHEGGHEVREGLQDRHGRGSFFAFGSGVDHALSAMWMGASAEEAVRAASAFDTGTGNGIDTIRL